MSGEKHTSATAPDGTCSDLPVLSAIVNEAEPTLVDRASSLGGAPVAPAPHPCSGPDEITARDLAIEPPAHAGEPAQEPHPCAAPQAPPATPAPSAPAPSQPATPVGQGRSAEALVPNRAEEPARSGASHALWDEPPRRRRPLPKRAVIAVSIAGALVLIPVVFLRGSTSPHASAPVEKAHEELIINERDLKNRRQVAPDDFRPRHFLPATGPVASSAAPGTAPALDQAKPDETMAERQKRRADDPEDLISHRGHSATGTKDKTQAEAESGGYRRPFVYFDPKSASSRTGGSNAPLVQAASTVSVVLVTPIEIHGGGSQTALARTDSDGPLPKGSRLLGAAVSDADGRLSIRFSRLILPDGIEAKIDAEAQDASGSFGLGAAAAPEGDDAGPTIAGEIARDTASEVASDALSTLTGGLAGGVARRALYRASPNRYSSPHSRSVSLSQGAAFQIFFHQAVVLHTPNEQGEAHAH